MTARLLLIEPGKLAPGKRAYNNAVTTYQGRLLMAYRLEPYEGPDRIAIAELDPVTYLPLSNAFVELSGVVAGENCEDPRLFVCDGRLSLSFSYARPCVFVRQLYAVLERHGDVWRGDVIEPDYGTNRGDGFEKNWSYFESGRSLYALYAPWRWEFIRIGRGGLCSTVDGARRAPAWDYGMLSGGTPPQRMADGNFVTLLHSHMMSGATTVYHVLAAVFEPQPPFALQRISAAPIMSGSNRWPFPPSGAPWCVFPAGLLIDGNRLIASVGINDCRCAIAELSFASLNLVPPVFRDAEPR